MQVAPSVEHLYEGHLGEVSKGWGRDLTPELEIVVELGNLVPRNYLTSQKLFVALRN